MDSSRRGAVRRHHHLHAPSPSLTRALTPPSQPSPDTPTSTAPAYATALPPISGPSPRGSALPSHPLPQSKPSTSPQPPPSSPTTHHTETAPHPKPLLPLLPRQPSSSPNPPSPPSPSSPRRNSRSSRSNSSRNPAARPRQRVRTRGRRSMRAGVGTRGFPLSGSRPMEEGRRTPRS